MSIKLDDLEKKRQEAEQKRREDEEKALKELMKYKDHEREEQKRRDRIK